ncbi:MAG: SoxR reducing system RseC family protein, partial [Rikenellaceae bacterium]|nr:SoxR reducing system RseC family protein [Rikenellaceae bacterium]
MAQEIQHSGTVVSTEQGKVVVRITSRSACGSCAAKQACGLAEAAEKIVEVYTASWADFKADDAVLVGVKQRIGMKAVGLAYVGALAVLIVALVVAIEVLHLSDGIAIVVALAALALYYGMLWLFRNRIEKTIQFTITT